MNKPRKIIFECQVGSKLYGTDRPDSDDDIMGVFIPSSEDMFQLQNPPSEWSMDLKISQGDRNIKGDIDKKYYSIKRFLQLAGDGQSKQLEMLFAPEDKIITKTPEWDLITKEINIFLSKESISPSIGFAKAQAYRAVVKGENLNLLREVINYLNNYEKKYETIQNALADSWELLQKIPLEFSDSDVICFEIAGRKFENTCSSKNVLKALKELEGRYGTRSETAAENGYDWKSLSHTYRLLYQVKELKTTSKMTFPLPKEQIDLIRRIKDGSYKADYFKEIQKQMNEIDKLDSVLPNSVNWKRINSICQEILYNYYFSN